MNLALLLNKTQKECINVITNKSTLSLNGIVVILNQAENIKHNDYLFTLPIRNGTIDRYTMDDEFFRLIKDPEFCRKAEEKADLRMITIMKLTDTRNAYNVAKTNGDSVAMEQLQKEIDTKQAELKKLS